MKAQIYKISFLVIHLFPEKTDHPINRPKISRALKILLQLCPNSSSTIKNVSSTFVAVYYLFRLSIFTFWKNAFTKNYFAFTISFFAFAKILQRASNKIGQRNQKESKIYLTPSPLIQEHKPTKEFTISSHISTHHNTPQ